MSCGKSMREVVCPVACRLDDICLDIGDTFGKRLAGLGFDDEMKPGQNLVGKLGVECRDLSVKSG